MRADFFHALKIFDVLKAIPGDLSGVIQDGRNIRNKKKGYGKFASTTLLLSVCNMQVDFAVQMALNNGMNLSPFSSSSQQALLSPINSFLGDHGNASIGGFEQTASGVSYLS